MARRLPFATALVALLVGLVAPLPASAEVDHGWDYRPVSIGGTYRVVVGQFAGDAADDILFYGPGTAGDSLWIGHEGQRGTTAFTKVTMAIGGDYTPVVGDFGGDGYDDILFYGPGSAPDSLWISANVSGYFDKSRKVSVGGAYQPKVLHDNRTDPRKDDILFLGPGAAKDYYWHFNDNGNSTYTSRELTVNGNYQLAIADLTGDFLDDVVLFQPGTAKDYFWRSNSAGQFAQTNLTIDGTYQAVPITPASAAASDHGGVLFWGNGAQPDAYWRSNGSTIAPVGDFLNPPSVTAAVYPAGSAALIATTATTGDYGFLDDPGSYVFDLDSAAHDQTTATPIVGNFDGDAKGYLDIIWYGVGTAKDELWYGDDTQASTNGAPRSAPTAARPVVAGPANATR